ncbi:MAG: hypothetical protein ACI8ZN_001345 [Bacteroidia bacterium]
MGSTQNISKQIIRKRLKFGALILSPILLIGVAAIGFQLWFGVNGEFSLFNFDIGKLWPWSDSKEVVRSEPIVETTERFRITPPSAPNETKSPYANLAKFSSTIPKVPKISNQTSLATMVAQRVYISSTDVLQVQPFIPENFTRSGKYIDLSKKDYLIPNDLKAKRSTFALGASFAPSVTYRRLNYNDLNAVARVDQQQAYTYGQSREYRKNNDRAILNFYSGVDFYYHPNSNWSFQTGFYYSSHGEKLQVIDASEKGSGQNLPLSPNSPFAKHQGIFDSPEMVDFNPDQELPFSNYYGFLEVPVLASYRILNLTTHTSFQIQLGASYAYLDHADAVLYNYETNQYYWIPSSDFKLFNKHFLNMIGGVSVSQYISEEIELFVNPQFKTAVTQTFRSDYEIKQNQWALGLRLGMKVHL